MRADGRNTFLKVGTNGDIIKLMIETYDLSKKQAKELVSELEYTDYQTQCRLIWDYFITNVRYRLDPGDNQFLKTPARLLADGHGDCKSYSLFFASCLHCLHIPFVFRFVSFSNSKKSVYSHVYVVAMPGTTEQIIFDAVETDVNGKPIFNYARPFIYNKDIAG